MNRKINIAFVKFGGMSNGGTEKVLQTIAAHLPKNKFNVDFFYCDSAPYIGSDYKHGDTDLSRVEYCIQNGVNLIKFNVGAKNVLTSTHDWVNTNFWEVFDENRYDIIQTGRSGHPEYPFTYINNTPIVDSIHLAGMAENKKNVKMTVLISEEQRQKWINAGGNPDKATIIPVPVEVPKYDFQDYRIQYGWEYKFIFGMHQRDNDDIYSHIPLSAYQKIETEDTAFLILGGSGKYKQQALEMNIKNIKFIETTSDIKIIHKFLNTLNVYAHGRFDGEQCSSAIIEALSHHLPIISHIADSNGQIEQIDNAGKVVDNHLKYSEEMLRMIQNNEYYQKCSENAKIRYSDVYNIDSIIEKYISIYENIVNC